MLKLSDDGDTYLKDEHVVYTVQFKGTYDNCEFLMNIKKFRNNIIYAIATGYDK